MTEPIAIQIRANWDSALAYDSLDRPLDSAGPPDPVFVGRKDLLDPLVAAIRQPGQRGTYLISGYRGTGKTTLVIEALRRALGLLTTEWRLFPVILNVSEVSASLEVGAELDRASLRIDPRRLLIALLRALEHRSDACAAQASGFPPDLKQVIDQTYGKAMAAEYSRTQTAQAETSRRTVRESTTEFKIADAYKVVTTLTGLAAAAIGTVALLGPALGVLRTVALALAAVSAASLGISRKVTKTNAQTRAEGLSLKFDNSLQQLENDLKDILARLYDNRLRTVVVLEELDKIQDERGEQLDAVIRYFKNLFTQAPALFFFVTDKTYFDLISSRIKRARRQRSYAVEHTFFTHRVFVGRPTTRDCLDYLCEIVSDPGQKSRLQAMYTTTEPRAKTLQAMDPFARFVRVLLFRAANHLFDLKNEMRRFARAGDSPGAGEPVIQLAVDDQSLPEDQAAVAILQDRVEEKAQAFALASGRAYANEVLHDCLYAVFNELGSTRAQRRADFYPFPPTEPAPDAGRPAELLLDEQLEWNEVQRIQEAVESLIEDLHRGGAFDADKTDSGKGEFMWKPNAARAFRYVRKLARHEEELVTTLQRLTAATEAFKPGAPLEWLVPDPNQAELLAQQLKQRTTEVQGSDVPLPVETALAESEDHRSRVTLVAAEAYKRQVARLSELYGLAEPLLVAPSSLGGGLYLLQTTWGDPRKTSQPRRGAVLLAQGDGDRLDDDVREFVAACPNLERLGLLHVLHAPGNPAAVDAWQQTWAALRPQLKAPAVTVEVLPLDEDLSGAGIAERWGQRLGGELLFRSFWAAQPQQGVAMESQSPADADPVVRVRRPEEPEAAARRLPMSVALDGWVQSSDRLLWLGQTTADDPVPKVLKALSRPEFTKVAALEAMPAATPTELSRHAGEQLRIASGLLMSPPQIERFSAVAEGSVKTGALILVLRATGPSATPPGSPALLKTYREALGDRGRGIVAGGELPAELSDLGITRLDV